MALRNKQNFNGNTIHLYLIALFLSLLSLKEITKVQRFFRNRILINVPSEIRAYRWEKILQINKRTGRNKRILVGKICRFNKRTGYYYFGLQSIPSSSEERNEREQTVHCSITEGRETGP